MTYNKKTWIDNELITTSALNNIEDGIEAVEQSIPKKTSQLENDSGYITEHLDLSNYAEKDELHEHNNKDVLDQIDLARIQTWDNASVGDNSVDLSNYVTKEAFDEFVNNSVEHIFITEAEYEALSEEDKNKEDVLYLITDGENVVIDFDSIDNRVKTLEEVEHVSLEQYNALLERVEQLEKALAELSPSEPDEESVPCTGISLTEETIILTLDNPTHQLKVILEPENTTDSIEWTSSNPGIAIVDNNGLVSINTETNSQGTSFIYAKCGTQTASCGVSVSL